LIEIDNVSKWFGPQQVLRGVSASLPAGKVLSLIGPSGSGKTTLLRCINFLETFEQGTIRIAGETVGYVNDAGRRIRRPEREIAAARAEAGMVFQSYNLFPHLTVLQNIIAAPVRLRRMTSAEAHDLAMDLLANVGLPEKSGAYPSELSGGQQQRVAIVRALAMRPRIMLFDEVTSALDPELVGEVLNVIRGLARDGMTMVIVTHEMQFAREVSSAVAFMAEGEILEIAPPDVLFTQPRHDRLKSFLARFREAYLL
jgi:polar amino acid transport system ATP-binding protein